MIDVGKAFERDFKKVLKLLTERHMVAHTRLTDTTAAGNIVSDTPCDYLVGLPPGSRTPGLCMVEIKASEKKTKLGKDMMTSSQRKAIIRYRDMLHIPYFVLFWDSANGVMQLWDGIAVIRDTNIHKRDMLAQWDKVGWLRDLQVERVADLLAAHFQIPSLASTLSSSQRRIDS